MATLTGPLNKSANTSGTTLVAKATTDTTYSASVGDMLVLAFVYNTSTAGPTVADSAGNTWVEADSASGGANNRLVVWTCRVTTALPTNGTVTVTCTSASRRASQLYKISAAGGFLTRDELIHATGATTALSLASPGSVGDADEYAFKFDGMTPAGVASGRADTSSGWTDKGTIDSGGTVVSVSLGSSVVAPAPNRSYFNFANTATQSTAVANARIGLTIRGISAPADTYVQSFSPVGQSLATMTATPLKTPVTGNTLIAVVATNENAGADDINCPAYWIPMGVIRNTAGTHVRMKLYGIHVADWIAAGSPAMTWTTTAAQRLQVTVAEFTGQYNLTPETTGTNQGTANTSGTSGSVTPLGTGRLVIMAVAEKNASPTYDSAAPPAFGAFTVWNEDPSVLSTQKINVLVTYVDNRGASATSLAATWTSSTAYAGIAASLAPSTEVAPTATVLDNFNTGANQNLDGRSGWGVAGRVTAGDQTFKTDATPTVAGVSLGTPASNLWATGMGADHEVYATLGTADTFYLVARGNTATGTLAAGYLAVVGWTGQIDIRTYSGTVLYTSTAGNFLAAPAAGDSYCFQAVGSTLTLWRRKSGGSWQVVVTITDSTYTTGTFVGMKAESGTTATITDFGAITLVAGGPATITPATGGVSFGGSGSITAATSVTPASTGVSFGGTGSITTPKSVTPASTGVTFSGTGAVTSIPRVSGTSNVTFSGTGAITSIPRVSGTSGVTFAGTGALTAPPSVTPATGSVTFSGTGAITATSVPFISGTTGVTFSGTGAITSIPQASGTSGVSFAGTGAITAATGITPVASDVSFGGSGSISIPAGPTGGCRNVFGGIYYGQLNVCDAGTGAASIVPVTAGVSFDGTAEITAPTRMVPTSQGKVQFNFASGGGSITAPTSITPAAAGVSFGGTGSITATPRVTPTAANVSFGGTGSISTAPQISGTANVTFSSTGAITGPAQIVPTTTGVSFAGTGSTTAPAYILGPGYLPGTSIDPSDLIYPDAVMNANVAFGGSGSITASSTAPVVPSAGSVSFAGTGSLTAPTFLTFSGTGVTFSGTGSVTGTPRITPATAGVTFSGTGSITTPKSITPATSSVTFSGTGSITTVPLIIPATSGVSFNSTGALTGPGLILATPAGVAFAGSASLRAPTYITSATGSVVFASAFDLAPFEVPPPPGGGGEWATQYAFPGNARGAFPGVFPAKFPGNRPGAFRRPSRSR